MFWEPNLLFSSNNVNPIHVNMTHLFICCFISVLKREDKGGRGGGVSKVVLILTYYKTTSLLLALVPQPASVVSWIDISGIRVGAGLNLLEEYMVGNSDMITLPFERFQLLSRLASHLVVAPSLFLLLIALLPLRLIQQLF